MQINEVLELARLIGFIFTSLKSKIIQKEVKRI